MNWKSLKFWIALICFSLAFYFIQDPPGNNWWISYTLVPVGIASLFVVVNHPPVTKKTILTATGCVIIGWLIVYLFFQHNL